MNKATISIFILLFCMISLTVLKYVVPTFHDVYSMQGDYVPSLSSVLEETKMVYDYQVSTKNGVLYKSYLYKNQETVEEDIQKYVNYLRQMEQFEVTKSYDLKDPLNTSVYLSKQSHVAEDKIISVVIDYTASSYQIMITKKKGKLLE